MHTPDHADFNQISTILQSNLQTWAVATPARGPAAIGRTLAVPALMNSVCIKGCVQLLANLYTLMHPTVKVPTLADLNGTISPATDAAAADVSRSVATAGQLNAAADASEQPADLRAAGAEYMFDGDGIARDHSAAHKQDGGDAADEGAFASLLAAGSPHTLTLRKGSSAASQLLPDGDGVCSTFPLGRSLDATATPGGRGGGILCNDAAYQAAVARNAGLQTQAAGSSSISEDDSSEVGFDGSNADDVASALHSMVVQGLQATGYGDDHLAGGNAGGAGGKGDEMPQINVWVKGDMCGNGVCVKGFGSPFAGFVDTEINEEVQDPSFSLICCQPACLVAGRTCELQMLFEESRLAPTGGRSPLPVALRVVGFRGHHVLMDVKNVHINVQGVMR